MEQEQTIEELSQEVLESRLAQITNQLKANQNSRRAGGFMPAAVQNDKEAHLRTELAEILNELARREEEAPSPQVGGPK